MNLQQYIESKGQIKIKADIRERWATRIEPRNLMLQGEEGAQVYLRDYGKSIAAPKVLGFAALATELGYQEFAAGFWKKAAQLEGVTLEVSDNGNPSVAANAGGVIRGATHSSLIIDEPVADFPLKLQPGKLAPMQPVDAAQPRDFLISNPRYWGQPKIDGNKMIVFASPRNVHYQSRTLRLGLTPDVNLHHELMNAAKHLGNFILEGELTFLDYNGGEHRTGSQAATANAELGVATFFPQIKFVVFSCLWRDGAELVTYGDMVDEGKYIAQCIQDAGGSVVTPIFTAKNEAAKGNMANDQQHLGREGEIWFDPGMAYRPGKHRDGSFVRTKYLAEFDADVIGFTETTAEGHAFGAMEIADISRGHSYGNVGTGFTREDKRILKVRFEKDGTFKVKIRCQGFTETGVAWHARFVEIVE